MIKIVSLQHSQICDMHIDQLREKLEAEGQPWLHTPPDLRMSQCGTHGIDWMHHMGESRSLYCLMAF